MEPSLTQIPPHEIPVRNPRTGIFDYHIQPLSTEQLQAQMTHMRQQQAHWKAAGITHRVEVMQRWTESIRIHKQALVDALCADTGRKWESLLEADIVESSVDRWCGISQDFFNQELKKKSSIPFLTIQQDFEPYPLVGVISPWNFPLLLSLIDTIPALLAGCAVIVKPSEVTPRFVQVIQRSLADVPELQGVLCYLEGAGPTGTALCQLTDIVCFTGSTATGRKVYQAACDNFIPVFLELGGKDAAIVAEGADLELASSALLWGSVVNAGQSCLSIERVYVQKSCFPEFLAKITAKAQALRLAFPAMESGQIGPIISDKQVEIINSHLADALAKGAVLHTGSGHCENHGGGMYCFPTILTQVTHDMSVMTEETFGPIIPIMPFDTLDEAIALANGTQYGLSGAVFAATEAEALHLGRQMQVGAVSINDAALTAVMHEGEKNSFKMSGIGGTRMGPSAIKRFMKQKAYLVKTNHLPDPWWFG
jgi:succinate-semialdehyde dehydrogenase / glutarate-semialdehyde dehydrogenase